MSSPSFSSFSTAQTARRLSRHRLRIGTYRNDLLVALRLINRVETDVLHAEYENFLVDENVRCAQLKEVLSIAHNETEKDGKRKERMNISELKEWYDEYCESCRAEMDALGDLS